MMLRNPPYKIAGVEMWACHGVPAITTLFAVFFVIFAMFEIASHVVPPVTLTAIWLEPSNLTAHQIADQNFSDRQHLHFATKMGKSGYWTRLCKSYAVQTFYDDRGNKISESSRHNIDVPRTTGDISHALRPIPIPKLLAKVPGRYKMRLDDYSICWPWEVFWPISSTSVEASFTVTP